ncbi:MAG: signal peptide peptidase SppA [Spirochaetaceae bacterium]
MINIIKKISKVSNKIRIGIINAVFWAIVISIILFSGYSGTKSTGNILLIQPSGTISETPGQGDILSMLSSRDLQLPATTLLKDILLSINIAATDSDISAIVLDLDFLTTIGFAQMEEIGNSLEEFKISGKQIYAYSSFYKQGHYYLASFADQISMDPFGEVSFTGISVYRNYWKETLDKYNVEVQVFRAGEYKSYVEPYLSTSMSSDVKRQNLVWMNDMWDNYTNKVRTNIGLSEENFNLFTNNKLSLVKKYSGDNSLLALEEGYVDVLETRSEFFNQFSEMNYFTDYLEGKKNRTNNMKIAVVTLEGNIVYSEGYNTIDAVETEALLDSIDLNEYEGLVIRINSGGGSAYASEIIRRKIQAIAQSIPVVISMGNMCASGGYWIATAGDIIFADRTTITGSIGVFAMIFGLEETLEELLSVHNDGISTISSNNNISPTKNISAESAKIYQLNVENTYLRFLNLVSSSRGIETQTLKNIAGGRVWSGQQALENGLVDNIGGLDDVKNYFIKEFGVKNVGFVDIEQELPLLESLTTNMFNKVKLPAVISELNMLQEINDPGNIFALWY